MWLKSAEFAAKFGLEYEALKKACARAKKAGKKFYKIKCNIFPFLYIQGKGRGGQVLQIWDEGFESEGEACEFLARGGTQNVILDKKSAAVCVDSSLAGADLDSNPIVAGSNNLKTQALDSFQSGEIKIVANTAPFKFGVDSSPALRLAQNDEVVALDTTAQGEIIDGEFVEFGKAPSNEMRLYRKNSSKITIQKQRNLTLQKLEAVKQHKKAMKAGISTEDFIANANECKKFSFKLTKYKLFEWARTLKTQGQDGLIDLRGGRNDSTLSENHKAIIIEIINAARGRVNYSSMWVRAHAELASLGECDFEAFKARECDVISYGVFSRFVKGYLKANPMVRLLIEKGEDAVVSAKSPALGVSNYKTTSINQIVEIDATSIDAIIDTSALAATIGVAVENVEAWQKRFVLIQLVDTYSGVCSFHISDTENSLGVARAIAKYITLYGKPLCIKSDNGSAFVSKYIQEVLTRLNIEHKRTPAYSGWCKPYVERNFGRLQNHLTEWMKGFIGHSVAQRQAVEFFFSRQQRRLKRGQKSNYVDLHTLAELGEAIDKYAAGVMNNSYLDRLNTTPTKAYNEKADEAIAMNAFDLQTRLTTLQRRPVGKKGIAYGGLYYYNVKFFNHDFVFVAENINNTRELFVYDENSNFLGAARALDSEKGVDAETAKRSQKHFKKRLKEVKREMGEAYVRTRGKTAEIYAQIEAKMPKTKKPAKIDLSDVMVATALESEAIAKAAGDEFVNEMRELAAKSEAKATVKRDLSWESAIAKVDNGK